MLQFMKTDFASESSCHYMLVFHYGSVVLFNVSDPEVDNYLKIVVEHASGLLPEMRKNGRFLSQSIALDYCSRQVDGMMAEFSEISHSMKKTGTCRMKIKQLFQLAWKLNSDVHAVILLKLGIFESIDVVKNVNYIQIWNYLWDKYEIMQRSGNLDSKLNFIMVNIPMIHDRWLEYIIICLIALDILIMLIKDSSFSLLQHFLLPVEGFQLLHPYFLVKPPYEHIRDTVDLILEAELRNRLDHDRFVAILSRVRISFVLLLAPHQRMYFAVDRSSQNLHALEHPMTRNLIFKALVLLFDAIDFAFTMLMTMGSSRRKKHGSSCLVNRIFGMNKATVLISIQRETQKEVDGFGSNLHGLYL
ncbi:hypothetical protein ZIOFF_013600 [Zingiber officinale]|uniref:DUF155 domain-containing protein n=1 Tax=Zingiber officinale TaxID=94328 RepID=A0A8J5LCY1_ZINOF|nr:hypothetical protein ZIOFF_013600 [Zingiber officinale]